MFQAQNAQPEWKMKAKKKKQSQIMKNREWMKTTSEALNEKETITITISNNIEEAKKWIKRRTGWDSHLYRQIDNSIRECYCLCITMCNHFTKSLGAPVIILAVSDSILLNDSCSNTMNYWFIYTDANAMAWWMRKMIIIKNKEEETY